MFAQHSLLSAVLISPQHVEALALDLRCFWGGFSWQPKKKRCIKVAVAQQRSASSHTVRLHQSQQTLHMALGVFLNSSTLVVFSYCVLPRPLNLNLKCRISVYCDSEHAWYEQRCISSAVSSKNRSFLRSKKADFKDSMCVYKDWHEGWQDISLTDRMALSPASPLWHTAHVYGNNWHRCHRGYHDNEDGACAHNLKNTGMPLTRRTSASAFLPQG